MLRLFSAKSLLGREGEEDEQEEVKEKEPGHICEVV